MMAALEYSRVHNAVGAAGVQRRALREALQWAKSRRAFGHVLADYPMVQHELLGIRVRFETAALLAFEAALTFDSAIVDTQKGTWLLVTALAKYLTAEGAIRACRATLELVGGNGYTSDYPIARIYRDSQVLTVWEGPANIQALELLRLFTPKCAGQFEYERRIRGVHRQSASVHVTAAERSSFTAAGRPRCNSVRYRRQRQLAAICTKAPGSIESQPRICLDV